MITPKIEENFNNNMVTFVVSTDLREILNDSELLKLYIGMKAPDIKFSTRLNIMSELFEKIEDKAILG